MRDFRFPITAIYEIQDAQSATTLRNGTSRQRKPGSSSLWKTDSLTCILSRNSTIARSFSQELMDIFRIENSVADLDAQVDKRYEPVPTTAMRPS